MTVKSDLDIAQANQMEHIRTIAERLSIEEDELEMYGKYKAKLPLNLIDENKVQKSNLILVSAITPTPAG
jgi:formate--tetrahydrofolate ligase